VVAGVVYHHGPCPFALTQFGLSVVLSLMWAMADGLGLEFMISPASTAIRGLSLDPSVGIGEIVRLSNSHWYLSCCRSQSLAQNVGPCWPMLAHGASVALVRVHVIPPSM
jgi:hypothetical protein